VVDAMKAGTKTEKTSANTVIINKMSIWTDPSGSAGLESKDFPGRIRPKDRPRQMHRNCKQDGDT